MVESEMVVHVNNLDEYRTVLKKWFKKGYDWYNNIDGKQNLHEEYFVSDVRLEKYLLLDGNNIKMSLGKGVETTNAMSFKEFMDKESGTVTTYDVSAEQLTFIKEARKSPYPATYLIWDSEKYKGLFSGYEYTEEFERDLLKYVSGDENVVFKVKNPDHLYLLKGKDSDGDTVYFRLNVFDIPTYAYEESDAFKAPHDEIMRWENSFWKIERVKD